MHLKRRRSSVGGDPKPCSQPRPPSAKKRCTRRNHPFDLLSNLSDELLVRILHNLPINTLLKCQRVSHRFYTLAGDSQIWKNLYYDRFVLPRALRIPGIRSAAPDDSLLRFSSKTSKWLDDGTLVNRADGKTTNWKRQYKLRHNWSIGACEVQEIHLGDRPSVPSMLVKMAEGVVLTANQDCGLRAWDLKDRKMIASCKLDRNTVPTCLAVGDQEAETESLSVAVGFMDGGWETWSLNFLEKKFQSTYRHPASSSGMLIAVAYSRPYVLTITDAHLLSLYSFIKAPETLDDDAVLPFLGVTEGGSDSAETSAPKTVAPSTAIEPNAQPRLLASLKSYTSWPPLSLSIRTASSKIIASIAYSLPTYLSGYTVGLQELHLSLDTGAITFSRLTSALPDGFSSALSSPCGPVPASGSSSPLSNQTTSIHRRRDSTRPTALSYSHPYILATHSDNTLTLYLCNSTADHLTISPGTKLWGHTSSISSAEITPRGKAVSVSTRGNELRVWDLEGGFSTASTAPSKKRMSKSVRLSEKSVMIRPEPKKDEKNDMGNEIGPLARESETSKRWVSFNDEMVIVLQEKTKGGQALMIYDFT